MLSSTFTLTEFNADNLVDDAVIATGNKVAKEVVSNPSKAASTPNNVSIALQMDCQMDCTELHGVDLCHCD